MEAQPFPKPSKLSQSLVCLPKTEKPRVSFFAVTAK